MPRPGVPTAGHDGRHTPAFEGSADIEVGHAVETQFHEVAGCGGVAGGEEFGHRSAGDGFAELRHWPKKKPRQPVAEGAFRLGLSKLGIRRWRSLQLQICATTSNHWQRSARTG